VYKVFGGGNDVIAIETRTLTLKASNRRDTQPGGEKWIFTIGFLDSPVAWIAAKIEHRREYLLDTPMTHLSCYGGEDLFDQRRVPCARQRDDLRVGVSSQGNVTMQAFLMENDGNSEAGILLHPLLNLVS